MIYNLFILKDGFSIYKGKLSLLLDSTLNVFCINLAQMCRHGREESKVVAEARTSPTTVPLISH